MRKTLLIGTALSLILNGVMPAFAEEAAQSTAPVQEQQVQKDPLNDQKKPEYDQKMDPKGAPMEYRNPKDMPNTGPNNGMPGFDNRGGNDRRDMGPKNGDPRRGTQDDRMQGNPGMNGEDFDKQDEERQKKDEERMKKEQERNAKRIKADVQRFAGDVKRMRSEITRQEKTLKKCKIGMPQDVTTALSETDALLAKVKTVTDPDELQDIQMELQEKMQTVRDSQQDFGYLQGFCRMLPEADKMIKKATSEFNRVIKQASKNKELDIAAMKTDFNVELDKIKGVLAQVKQTMTTEPEEAMQAMQDDFFQGFEDVYNVIGYIDSLANSGKGVTMLEKQLKRVKKNLDSLKKKGKDVEELSASIAELESAVKAIKDLRKQKKFDAEDLRDAFMDAFAALEEAGDALEDLGIQNPDYAKNFGPAKGPQLNVPQFKGLPEMQKRGGPQDGSGPGMGGQNMGPGGDQGDDQQFDEQSKAKESKQVAKR